MSRGVPIHVIVPCPECEHDPVIDPMRPCPVCKGEAICVSLRPWERHQEIGYFDAHSIKAYTEGFKDGMRLAKSLRERTPSSTLYPTFAVMTP